MPASALKSLKPGDAAALLLPVLASMLVDLGILVMSTRAVLRERVAEWLRGNHTGDESGGLEMITKVSFGLTSAKK